MAGGRGGCSGETKVTRVVTNLATAAEEETLKKRADIDERGPGMKLALSRLFLSLLVWTLFTVAAVYCCI